MKKIIILFITIFSFVFFNNISYAMETGTVYIDTDKTIIDNGEEVEITVNIKDAQTAAFELSIYFDNSKLEYISEIENTNIKSDHILFVWHDSTGGRNAKQGELAKFKFKAKEKGRATFIVVGEFYNASAQLINTQFEAKQIQIGRQTSLISQISEEEKGDSLEVSNTNLQALRLDIAGMVPNFEKDIYKYYLTIPNSINNIEVLAVTENENASVEITGNTNLKDGLNEIKVQVTSENKEEKQTYIIEVTKTADLNLANTNLETLAIEGVLLNPPFDKNEVNYTVDVGNEVTDLNILAIPENEGAKVQISGENDLKEGNNLVTIIVTAQNGITKKVYQINVHKRNLEEETKHKEEQEKMQEQLEQAYEIEKISDKNENTDNTKENTQSNKNEIGIIIGTVMVVVITIAFWYFKYKKK